MEGQGAQVQRVSSNTEVNSPNVNYVSIFRDNSNGNYYGKLSDGTIELIGGSSVVNDFKQYVAVLNQSGVADPIASINKNTLSGTPVWSRSSAGLYLLTLPGEFPDPNKIVYPGNSLAGAVNIVFPGGNTETSFALVQYGNINFIALTSFYNSQPPADDLLVNFSFELRVYP